MPTAFPANVFSYGATGNGSTDDTAAIQAAINAVNAAGGGVVAFPAGTYLVGSLTGYPNVALLGAGRESAILKANANSINILTVTGTATDSAYEVAHASPVVDLGFDANGHTGCEGIAWIGVAYFTVERCTFDGFTVGVEFYGSLQGRVDDCKFLSNATGIKYDAQTIGYYGGTLPPNRVSVTWSTFYYNTSRAVDFAGGEQLILDSCEFGDNGTAANASTAAVWFAGSGDPNGPGLSMRDCWIEANHGKAAVNIADSSSNLRHSLSDCWFAYTDATYGVAVDSTSGTTYIVFDRCNMDTVSTVRTYYRTGATNLTEIFNDCTGTLAGSGGTITQTPTLV